MNLAFGTPTLVVRSNRGLPVRALTYNRASADTDLDERIERTVHDLRGRVASRIDARLFSAGAAPNFVYTASLTARVSRIAGVDAGVQLALADVDGRPVWARDGRGTVTTRSYDPLGRPLSATDTPAGGLPAVLDAWVYGEALTEPQANNLSGRCVRRYDTAGRLTWTGFRLTGQPVAEIRTLLADPDAEPDWQGDEASWTKVLEPVGYSTAWSHDATGAWHSQIDAKGNVQAQRFDVAGRLAANSLTLAGGVTRPVLATIDYSAAGQVLRETTGNGVVSIYAYEPETLRLARRTVTRPVQSGRKSMLQDLHYAYDPVGNVASVQDAAQPATYWRNQRVEPICTYAYDALYQLISATGREMVNCGQQGTTLPPVSPLPGDDTVYAAYTRRYAYDRGDNLMRITHQGALAYTQDIVVSASSNHALAQTATKSLTPTDVDTGRWFDASGNQQNLLPNRLQPLAWNSRNRLRDVTLVQRDIRSDRETYQYGSDGMRVRKCTTSLTSGTIRYAESVYLPGVTLRLTRSDEGQTAAVVAVLQEIRLEAGRASIRALRWDAGQPQGVANDALRYGYAELIGSIGLELDAQGDVISREEYYPYGGTAVWTARSQVEADTRYRRYSGKEFDATGLYDYGWRSYQPWIGRWLNPDPAGTVDGLDLYRMVDNNPVSLRDPFGLWPGKKKFFSFFRKTPGNNRVINEATSASSPTAQTETSLGSTATRPVAPEYQPAISMDSAYEGETDRGVDYLDENQREQHAAIIQEGVIRYKSTGSNVNPESTELSGEYTDWAENMMAYVIATDNTLYVAKHETGKMHHSSFTAGGDVRDAGMMAIANGQLLFFNAKSGHYKPSFEQKLASVDYFHEHGVDLSSVFVVPHPTSRFDAIHHLRLYRANSLRLKGMQAAPRWEPTATDRETPRPSGEIRARLKAMTARKGLGRQGIGQCKLG